MLGCDGRAVSDGDVERIVAALRARTAPVKMFWMECASSEGLRAVVAVMVARAELFREVEEVNVSCQNGDAGRCGEVGVQDVVRVLAVAAQSAALMRVRVSGLAGESSLVRGGREWGEVAAEVGSIVTAMGRRAVGLRDVTITNCGVSGRRQVNGASAVEEAVEAVASRLRARGSRVRAFLRGE